MGIDEKHRPVHGPVVIRKVSERECQFDTLELMFLNVRLILQRPN